MSAADPAAGLHARWSGLRAAWRRLSGGSGDGPLTTAEQQRIARGISRLSEGLTRDRALVGGRYLDDPELLGAYLLFYWPVSYAQARAVLAEVARPLGRVLDLGAGPMPMSWAAMDAGATAVHASDRVERALALGRSLGEGATTSAWDPERGDALPPGTYDTITAGHVVNELFLGARALDRRVVLVQAALARASRVVLIEPALRDTGRALLQLRDRLVAVGAIVHAPCLVQGTCPALERPTDWCHAERAWQPPDELVALSELAKIHKERLKLSYLVLAPGDEQRVHDEHTFRIVSEPLVSKGKRAWFGCGPRGRHPLVRRDRDANERTAVFDELRRGDVIRVERLTERGDGLRLDPDAPVERVAGAGEPLP